MTSSGHLLTVALVWGVLGLSGLILRRPLVYSLAGGLVALQGCVVAFVVLGRRLPAEGAGALSIVATVAVSALMIVLIALSRRVPADAAAGPAAEPVPPAAPSETPSAHG